MNKIDQVTKIVIMLFRGGCALRLILCFIKLVSADDEAATYKRRIKNVVIAYVIVECVWQLKDLALHYFGG